MKKISKYRVLYFIILSIQINGFGQAADIALVSGKIFTADSARPYVQALAIKGNKILAIGTDSEIKKLVSAQTKIIELKGKTVVPGFNDAHDHLGWMMPSEKGFLTSFSIPGPSKKEVIDSLSLLIKKTNPGEWIHGSIGLTVFTDTSIRRRLLDSIAPHNPLALLVMWGHGVILNTKALEAIHVTDKTADPLGGWYERTNDTNQITGAMYEYAQFPVWKALTADEPATLLKNLRFYAATELEYGITTVQNMSGILDGNAAVNCFQKANLPLRVRIIAMPGTTTHGRSLKEWRQKHERLSTLIYTSGIKYVIDGTSLEQTSLRSKPYPNRPGYYGRMNFPVDTIRQILKEALTSDSQLMLHITGDSATKVVLQLMKEMAAPATWRKKRVRIEHGNGIATEALAKDIKELGIIIVNTPQYGMKNRLRTWLQAGIPVAIAPDGLTNPFVNIMMITGQQSDKSENLTREEAVIAYTRTNAYAEFTEKQKGTLTPGKLADMAVLSQDIFTISSNSLPATRSVMTIVDGQIKFLNNK